MRPVPSSRDVAQPGRALAWGARGRQFKSARPDQFKTKRLRVTSDGTKCTGEGSIPQLPNRAICSSSRSLEYWWDRRSHHRLCERCLNGGTALTVETLTLLPFHPFAVPPFCRSALLAMPAVRFSNCTATRKAGSWSVIESGVQGIIRVIHDLDRGHKNRWL